MKYSVIFFKILEIIFYIAAAYILLSTACEYRMGKHLLVKAFYAKTPYQTLFTLMQMPKDIEAKDLGKLTYIGYIGVLLSTIAAVVLFFYSIYQYCTKVSFSLTERLQLWASFCFVWGVFAIVIQMLDSFIGWLIWKFGRRIR